MEISENISQKLLVLPENEALGLKDRFDALLTEKQKALQDGLMWTGVGAGAFAGFASAAVLAGNEKGLSTIFTMFWLTGIGGIVGGLIGDKVGESAIGKKIVDKMNEPGIKAFLKSECKINV